MKVRKLFLGLGIMAGFVAFTFTANQALAIEDEWTDYDPCGWNVEQDNEEQELTIAQINEDKWTDHDPCGWEVEQETMTTEIAETSRPLFNDTDYMN